MERTLAVIKPDAVGRHLMGEIIKRYEEAGLRIVALKMLRMTKKEAEALYHVHRTAPFYDSLTTFMSSDAVVAMVLEGEGAVKKNREIMGATDPRLSAPGTLRKDFGATIERNVVHGSDSKESATFEIPFFFSSLEIVRHPPSTPSPPRGGG